MNLIDIWWELNLSLALVSLCLFLGQKFLRNPIERGMLYRLSPFLFALSFIFIMNPRPQAWDEYAPPVIKRYSQEWTNKVVTKAHLLARKEPIIRSVHKHSQSVDVKYFLFWGGILAWLIFILREIKMMKVGLQGRFLMRRHRSLSIYICPQLGGPCSFWFFGKSFVFLPEYLLGHPENFYLSLKHELQHHRQGDTRYAYLLELLRGFFFFNPAVHLYLKQLLFWQEYKCDQNVLAQGVSPRAYGNCLIEVASKNQNSRDFPLWGKAMASFNHKILRRRINMICHQNKKLTQVTSAVKFVSTIGLIGLFMWQFSLARVGGLSKKEMSLIEAKKLVSQINRNNHGDIPVEVNETVLKWLNYFMVDPKGRAYTIVTLERMHAYKDFIKNILKEEKMPIELLAVPFMESGYNNQAVSTNQAAGLWQFMKGTAQRFGLVVDDEKDERTHVEKATRAAMEYYRKLLAIDDFEQDWRLALLAYNTGESRLKDAIKEQGTLDPWQFNDLGDQDYLGKIMAGIILLKNPKMAVFSTPLEKGIITSRFGYRKPILKNGRLHNGLDLKAPVGTIVKAPMEGKVKFAGFKSGYGKLIVLDHGEGIETKYAHLAQININKNDQIFTGQNIGRVGSTGISSGPHLHFEVWLNGKATNPEIFLQNNKIL